MRRKTTKDQVTIRGRVEAVFYAGPRFSAGRLATSSDEEIQFAGRLFVREHEPAVLRGRWITHPKYGRQFDVEAMEYDLELGTDGLAHYLANHPEIKGIGPVKARLIAKRFGHDFDQALIERPESVAETAKFPLAAVEKLRDERRKAKEVSKAITWLAAFGLTHHQVTSLVKKLGNNVLGMLKADPYLIVREVRGFGFKRVDEIARKMGTPKEHNTRIRAGLLNCVEKSLNDGDRWTEYEELVDRANTLLVMNVLDNRERIEKSLDALIEDSSLSCTSLGAVSRGKTRDSANGRGSGGDSRKGETGESPLRRWG